MDDAEEKMIVAPLMVGLLPSKFLFFSKNPLSSMTNFMVKTQQHINGEDTLNARRERDVRPSSQLDKRKSSSKPRGKKGAVG